MKHYKVFVEKVAQLRSRFNQECEAEVTALDVEKVGCQVNERAQARRKEAVDDEGDGFLLRPLVPRFSMERNLGRPLRDEEHVPKHRSKKISNGSYASCPDERQ